MQFIQIQNMIIYSMVSKYIALKQNTARNDHEQRRDTGEHTNVNFFFLLT